MSVPVAAAELPVVQGKALADLLFEPSFVFSWSLQALARTLARFRIFVGTALKQTNPSDCEVAPTTELLNLQLRTCFAFDSFALHLFAQILLLTAAWHQDLVAVVLADVRAIFFRSCMRGRRGCCLLTLISAIFCASCSRSLDNVSGSQATPSPTDDNCCSTSGSQGDRCAIVRFLRFSSRSLTRTFSRSACVWAISHRRYMSPKVHCDNSTK